MGLRVVNVLPPADARWSFRLEGRVAMADEGASAEPLEPGLKPWPDGEERGAVRALLLPWAVDFEQIPVEISRSR